MIGSMRVLALIPARGGSKGVPGKNIRPVGGRPLLAWTIAAAQASAYVDLTILSSDDPAIIEVAREYGCDVPFQRPAELATDTATSVDVALDAVERIPGYDILVLLQPTSPLRTATDIDAALDLLVQTGASGCASVCEVSDHPWLTFGRDAAGRLSAFCALPEGVSLRRQDLPPAYVLNGAVYAIRTDKLKERRAFFEPDQTVSLVMPIEKSLDVDTWDDIRLVDEILSRTTHQHIL
jgi:CMP-N,N'-diacetyllegionaminic acid synthase